MAGNIFSNAGLFMQGMNQAEMDRERLAQTKQQTAEGALGLQDLTRASQEQESMRSAIQANQSIHDSLIAQADALRNAGNPKWQEAAKEAMQLPQQNADMMAEAALSGASAEQIEEINERNMGANRTYDKGSLQVEHTKDNHVILRSTKGGKPLPPIDVTAYYAKKQKPVTVGQGAALVNPATKEVIYANDKPRTTISISKTEGGEQAQKELPMFNAISKQIAGHPDMGTLDQFGNPTLTPAGNIKAAIGNQIAQTNRNLDPATVVNIVMNGKPKVNPKTGEKAIEYKGKYYRYSEGSVQPQGTLTTKETTRGFAQGGKVNHKGIC